MSKQKQVPKSHFRSILKERRLSVVRESEKSVRVNLARAERLRQAILRRAFEGKLVGQDVEATQRAPLEKVKDGTAV